MTLTEKQKIILTAMTGINCCDSFSDFHKAIQEKLNRPVWTHELGSRELYDILREAFTDDFKREFLWSNVN